MAKLGRKTTKYILGVVAGVNEEIFFNAARLDRSMALRTSDYLAITQPRIEKIAASAE